MAVCIARVLILSTVLTCFMLTSGAPSRTRRQVTGFTVISNESLPCVTMMELYGSEAPIELSEEERYELFIQYGGQFLSNYMATSREEAINNFDSLLPLEKHFGDQIKKSRPSDGKSPTNKKVISDYMMTHVYNGFTETDREQDNKEESKQHAEPGSQSGSQSGNDSESHSKKVRFHDMLEGMRGETDIQARRRGWRSWSKQNGRHGNFPLIFPEMMDLPKTVRNTDNSVSTNEGCLVRGDFTSPDEQHVRLCTVCSSTTVFGEEMWPPIVNEATCMAEDDGCLYTDSFANGSCQQMNTTLNMLQKNNNYCVLVLKDGQNVVAYEWEFVTRNVGVGCQCNVKSNSYFVIFV